MARAPFQVLVLLYRFMENRIEYCIFKRSDGAIWQFVSGGGEDSETKNEAAKRELREETSLDVNNTLISLDTVSSVPANCFKEIIKHYPKLYVVPEYCFAMAVDAKICLSGEHKSYRWVSYSKAMELLKYDSNKTALFELSQRLKQE